MSESARLQTRLDTVPAKPGCYLMKDAEGEVIYVGKAVNLRNRVRSYFHASASHSRKTAEMMAKVEDVEWIVVGSELESLILEMNLIKRHRPKYNLRLKDDKRYPFIKIHWSDPFPKVTVTRRTVEDGSRYYGPYTSAWAVHETLDVLRKVFPYLTCDRVITGEDSRACLYYDIKLCIAPCIGAVDQDTYRAMIEDLCRFLEGKTEPIVDRLQREMQAASEKLEYERAAVLRDQLSAIEKVVENQIVVMQERIDSDVIAFARDEDNACVQVFFIRRGKLIGREYFLMEGTRGEEDQEILEAFVKQFYRQAPYIPHRVMLPAEIEEARIIQSWLESRRGGRKVKIHVPKRGVKRGLVELAAENAADTLAMLRAQWQADRSKQVEAMAELQDALGLRSPPVRIECYDVSNLQGTAAAGSMVVFEQGVPSKSLYRKFTIKSVDGQDDFASMEEVLSRRFRRWQIATEEAEKPGTKLDPSFGILADLLIVDGGRGQLSRAVKVLQDYGLEDSLRVVALAKNHEELFVPGKVDPVLLPRDSQGLYLVQRLRDEAHRFALRHHQSRRRKTGTASLLDAVHGIGPARRKRLLETFGDLEAIKQAPMEKIAAVPGINEDLARRVKEGLQ